MYGYSIQSVTSLYRCSNLQHVLPPVRIALQTGLSGDRDLDHRCCARPVGDNGICTGQPFFPGITMELYRSFAIPVSFFQISEFTGMYAISFMIVMVNQFLSQLPELFTRRKEDASNVIAARIFDSKVFVLFILIIAAIGFILILWGTENQIVGERCLSSCGHDSGQCCHKKQDDIA
jgi:hypothetical protein